jgi:hypothetical protein
MPGQKQRRPKSVDERIEALVAALEAEARTRAEADAGFHARLDSESKARAEAEVAFHARLDSESKARAEADAASRRLHAEAIERLNRIERRQKAHGMNLEMLTADLEQQRGIIDEVGQEVRALTNSMETMRQLQVVVVDLIRSHDARIGRLEQR